MNHRFSHSVINALEDNQTSTASPIFSLYESATPVIKGRQRLQKNMISLIMQGEKMIHFGGESIHVQPENILL